MWYFCAKFLWIKGVFYHGLCVIIYAGRIVPCLHWYLICVIGRMTSLEWFSICFRLVKNGKDWNPAIPLVKRIFLVPDHIWPKTIKGQPALTHVIRNYVLLLVVPPLCLWWVTHAVTKALRLKILPGQQLPLFPNPPTLLTKIMIKKWQATALLGLPSWYPVSSQQLIWRSGTHRWIISSNELLWLDLKKGHQVGGSNNGHQSDMPSWDNALKFYEKHSVILTNLI